MSTSRDVRKDMKDWVLTQEGDKWFVKFDVRDLEETFGHYFLWMVFDFSCQGSSGHFSSCSDFCSPSWIFMVGYGLSGLCICLLLSMGLKLLCLLLRV